MFLTLKFWGYSGFNSAVPLFPGILPSVDRIPWANTWNINPPRFPLPQAMFLFSGDVPVALPSILAELPQEHLLSVCEPSEDLSGMLLEHFFNSQSGTLPILLSAPLTSSSHDLDSWTLLMDSGHGLGLPMFLTLFPNVPLLWGLICKIYNPFTSSHLLNTCHIKHDICHISPSPKKGWTFPTL